MALSPESAAAAPAPVQLAQRPQLTPFKTIKGTQHFTMSGVHVSVANAIRRTILGRIPTLGIVGFPEANTTVEIILNTTPFHNELIKQRLECIPFGVDPLSDPATSEQLVNNLEVRLNVRNDDPSQVRTVTTADLELWDTQANKQFSPEQKAQLLPADPITGEHELLVILRPPVGTQPGDALKLTATVKEVVASDSSAYALASTCAYGNSEDTEAKEREWAEAAGPTPSTDPMVRTLWEEQVGRRFKRDNSYDWQLRSIGWITEGRLLVRAIEVLQHALAKIADKGDAGNLNVTKVKDALAPHTFDVEITGDTYTLGHLLRHQLYDSVTNQTGLLRLVGFDKHHAHDKNGVLRMVFQNDASAVNASHLTARAAREVIAVFQELLPLAQKLEASQARKPTSAKQTSDN